MDRFERRFGCAPVEWHSALSPGGARPHLEGVRRVVRPLRRRRPLGAFSAVLELGLIVVDEEHDQGFKQEDRVHYQGRDMAVVRGNLGKFPVVLASATPSIESHVNALVGRYRHAILPGRFSGVAMPDVSAIDLRQEKLEPGKWLASRLVAAMTETLEKGQQTLLFLNRRGYAPLTLCRSCGHRSNVRNVRPGWLSIASEAAQLPPLRLLAIAAREVPEVRRARLTRCLRTGHRARAGGSGGAISGCATGVAVVRSHPRSARNARDDQRYRGAAKLISSSARRSSPRATTFLDCPVGIVDGDLGLAHGADPRAAERTFQLLHQVTGRAGRTSFVGRGFVQT